MSLNASNELLEFYLGRAPDHRGRYLHEILTWTDNQLEDVHDYIQWLFPTFERSAFQPNAPILTKETASTFRASAELKDRLKASFKHLLRFYGLALDESTRLRVTPGPNFQQRAETWLASPNHNHLRITRILKSLTALGLREQAEALLLCLEEIYDHSPGVRNAVSERTLGFWRSGLSVS